MKVEHAFSAKAVSSVYCSSDTGRICLTVYEPDGARGGEMVNLWFDRAKLDSFTNTISRAMAETDRIAAAKRGEAVPAAPVSDGEAARQALANLVTALIAEYVTKGDIGGGVHIRRANDPVYVPLAAACALLGVEFTS